MKKDWTITWGVISIIFGIVCIPTDFKASAFYLAVGAVLIAWWNLSRKKSLNKRSEVKQQISKASTEETGEKVISQSAVPTKPKPSKFPSFPVKKDGAIEAYRYRIAFTPSSPDIVTHGIQEERWYLTARIESGVVHLFLDGNDLGVLPERSDMMADWLQRGDPYVIAIEQDKNGSSFVVTLVFYKDKQKYNAHREQDIVSLTGYKSKRKQDAISFLEIGEELEAEEDPENEDRVLIVNRAGDVIGSLPKKYAQRVMAEGTALIVFDHDELIEDSDIYKPFVKIYW